MPQLGTTATMMMSKDSSHFPEIVNKCLRLITICISVCILLMSLVFNANYNI